MLSFIQVGQAGAKGGGMIAAALAAAAPALFFGCVSPSPQALDQAQLTSVSESRQRLGPQTELALTLKEVGILPTDLGAPDAKASPRTPNFWRATALAWDPEIRRARRQLEVALGRELSAGSPGPLGLGGEVNGDDDLTGGIQGSFDLIGVLGLEPSAAAVVLARSNTSLALATLEERAWSTRFEVDADRVRLAAVRARISVLKDLAAEAEADFGRFDALLESGRVGHGIVSRGRAMLFGLHDQVGILRTMEATLLAALARRSGLRADHPALEAVTPEVLGERPTPPNSLSTRHDRDRVLARIYEQLPSLRRARREYAVAEAQLRVAAAASWPALRIGPKLSIGDNLIPGGLVAIELPFPGSWEGGVAAAHTTRNDSRERIEDLLINQMNEVTARLAAFRSRRAAVEDSARQRELYAGRAWRAARASVLVNEKFLSRWIDAFESRGPSLVGLVNAREDEALAALDLQRLGGPSQGGARP
ncbi:MAG: hypothetical protein V3W41_22645 [Planctomycetota bacterium]